MMMTRRFFCSLLTVVLVSGSVHADGDQSVSEMRRKAVQFLEVTQSRDGSWSRESAVGITGLVTAALLRSGKSSDDPVVSAGLKNLVSHVKPDGGVYAEGSFHRNYETCIAILTLSEANEDGRYTELIRGAEGFLKGLQWDRGEGIESSDPRWGGGGYGSHQRPDMSNTQYLIDALKAAGVQDDDPAMQKVLVFVSRTQNLETEHNDTEFAGKINDGGFYYTPAAGGESKAGVTDNGGLRSYGSMTYAGLKSFIYAGLDHDDQRIQAATDWIRRNYTLAENPGMDQQGLYYYFHTFAKTMNALGQDKFEDASGTRHDWQQELITRLSDLQQKNGSWVNPADRWYEGDPNMVTAYCLLALSYCDSE